MQYLWKKQEPLHLGPFNEDKDCQEEEESTSYFMSESTSEKMRK